MGYEYEDVPYIMFRKQLSVYSKPTGALEGDEGLRPTTNAQKNTVLVFQATKINQLLNELEISGRIEYVVQANALSCACAGCLLRSTINKLNVRSP